MSFEASTAQSTSNNSVRIVEVGPRDGLQNIRTVVPTSVKVELIKRLVACGLSVIEATSFVSPKFVPQLADCLEILSCIKPLYRPNLRFSVLVANLPFVQAAIANGAQEVAVFVSATEGFSKKNTGCTVDEALSRARQIAQEAKKHNIPVRGYVSCIFACPYDGPTSPHKVLRVVLELVKMGCYEISLGDTIGVGTLADVKKLLKVLFKHVSPGILAGHFHDTYGQSLANVLTAYQMGLRTFDSSIAGLGGCPYAEGATGNLATEDVVYMFEKMGVSTGVDLDALVDVGTWISSKLKRENGSRAGTALSKKRTPIKAQTPTAPAPLIPLEWLKYEGTNEYSVFRSGTNLKVVLERPENGNSLTLSMLRELTALFKDISQDRSISRVIIAASGKFYCTGMDLSPKGTAANSSDRAASDRQFELLKGLFEAVDNLPQTTIALINGSCFGGGVGLAFVCDIRLAAASSQFTLSEVKLGLCPAVISKYIVREWGVPFARHAMLTGRAVGAAELLRLGILQGVTADTDGISRLLDEQLGLLRFCAPRASTLCKDLVKVAWQESGSELHSKMIRKAYDEMMEPSAEAKYGLEQFRKGKRNVMWESLNEVNAKL